MTTNLNHLLDSIKSKVIRERTEGLTQLRTVFARDSVVLTLDNSGQGTAWLLVFQAVFTAVLNEKDAFKKQKSKSTAPAAARRLSEAASAVRWLTERAVQRLNGKVIKALLNHLLQLVASQGTLFEPVALDYIKALRCVVGFGPHLEHLDDKAWIRMVQLAFNVILGDPIDQALDDDTHEDEDMADEVASVPETASDLLTGDDNEDDVNVQRRRSAPLVRKRRREETASPTKSYKGTSRPRARSIQTSTVTLEQIELASLLAVLLCSTNAPILSNDYGYLPRAIFLRLSRFLTLHSTSSSSSLHPGLLSCISATLGHLALNAREEVASFSRNAWEPLVTLWVPKNRAIKEALLCILRLLFPYYIASPQIGSPPDWGWTEGVKQLWERLNGEAESRWGLEGLNLGSLRLEWRPEGISELGAEGAFRTGTFGRGWGFTGSQALAWALLELHADCTAKLFLYSESVFSGTQARNKRSKLDDPISGLIATLLLPTTSAAVRSYRLQTLLFFISRHWSLLHQSLQGNVFTALLQLLAFDDGTIQSLTFMCFSAIVHADYLSSGASLPLDASSWDAVWTHAIRRANVPAVSRAALHTAYVLLFVTRLSSYPHAKTILTANRVLVEIENLAKDIDVQGPPILADSICAFLTACLRVASQDVRLYRMQLEEKVLSWLTDVWGRQGLVTRDNVPPFMVNDVMTLLESICALSKPSDLVCRLLLPRAAVVDSVVDEHKTAVIRDFLLDARLPEFRGSQSGPQDVISEAPSSVDSPKDPSDLVQPRGRERRMSAFLLKLLESLLERWETAGSSVGSSISAENARANIDVAIIAISFESLLVCNGTRAQRRVLQYASKLVSVITPRLLDTRWTMDEKVLVLQGLGPLVSSSDESFQVDAPWEVMLPPDEGTGIKSELLRALTDAKESRKDRCRRRRLSLQKIIWQSSDIQDNFSTVMHTLRDVLGLILDPAAIKSNGMNAMDIDDADGFGPIRTTHTVDHSAESRDEHDRVDARRRLAEICVAVLSVAPILQSTSGEPVRDQELTELLLESPDEAMLLVAPFYFAKVQDRTLNLSVANLDKFVAKFGDLLLQYGLSRSERMQLLLVQSLDSTLHVWLQPSVHSSEVGDNIRDLCHWLSIALRTQKIKSWRIRDRLAQFLSKYLYHDPHQAVWLGATPTEESLQAAPVALTNLLGADEDIHIRFRAGVANPHLFALARHVGRDAMTVYSGIIGHLTADLTKYEHMLTRILTLGNIMVVSSAVRRGPYWHLLETCLERNGVIYAQHIESLLRAVSQRMGLATFAALFESYASQIAYSIREAGHDFLRFPPQLLGYQDRKEYAEVSFRAFTPANVAGGNPASVAHGHRLFANHCKAISRSQEEGFRDCFGDVVGFQIVSHLDAHYDNLPAGREQLGPLLQAKVAGAGCGDNWESLLQSHADSVMFAILRTVGDFDVSPEGVIATAVERHQPNAVAVFRALVQHRTQETFALHLPNVPYYSTTTVLLALQWFETGERVPDFRATAYHVVHQIYSGVQKSPLVNEQLRLLTCLCLLIALHERKFKETTLLHAVTHGAALAFEQFDLARSAQSILQWAFGVYQAEKCKDVHFGDILIRICTSAHKLSLHKTDPSLASAGADLLSWINGQVVILSSHPTFSSQIASTLSSWPCAPPVELMDNYEEPSSETLSSVLADNRISSSKFCIVRRLRDLSMRTHDVDSGHFAKTNFWQLKSCIPPGGQMSHEDMAAFSDLLLVHKGQIESFRSEVASVPSLLARHRGEFVRRKDPLDSSPTKCIVYALLAMLNASDASEVHVAYRTLRLLMSAGSPGLPFGLTWPPELRKEVEYLQKHPVTPTHRSPGSVEDLLDAAPIGLATDFPRWIAAVTLFLSDLLSVKDPFYAQLHPILQSNHSFARDMLPLLVLTVLQDEVGSQMDVDETRQAKLSHYFTSILAEDRSCVACRRSIVETVLHTRNFFPANTFDPQAGDKWLQIDYTLLARNSLLCGSYTTALLFLELAAEYRRSDDHREDGVEQIMYDIYNHIDEPDGFYGIKTKDHRQFLLKRFHHENEWDKAFRFHGAALQAGSLTSGDAEGLLQSFHSFGFDHLAIDALQSSSMNLGSAVTTSGMSYRLGWRTETWDLPNQTEQNTPDASLYLALRAIYRERDRRTVDRVIEGAMREEMGRLRDLGSESLLEIRKVAQTLMCLSQVAQWRGSSIQDLLRRRDSMDERWSDVTAIHPDFEFSDLENVMATRMALIRSVRQREEREQIGDLKTQFTLSLLNVEKRCLVRLSHAAREANQGQIALNSIIRAQNLEPSPSFDVSQEFAQVLWLQGEQRLAVQFLGELVKMGGSGIAAPTVEDMDDALLLARLGSWTSEACLEKPTDILGKYFDPATSFSNDCRDKMNERAVVYHQSAIFAEHQYQAILKSPDAIRWKIYVDRKVQELRYRHDQLLKLNEESSKHKILIQEQNKAKAMLEDDMASFTQHSGARDAFLKQAIDMFSRCLELSDAFDDDGPIRLCSLWFSNFEDAPLQQKVRAALDRVPSRKFVFLAHQLSARLSKSSRSSENQDTLHELMVRMCKEHPFHSLYQVFCLRPAGQPSSELQQSRRQSARHESPTSSQSYRAAAANDIFDRLRCDPSTADRVANIEKACDAYLQWAQFPIKGNPAYKHDKTKPKTPFLIPPELMIRKLKDLKVPILTADTPLDPTTRYENCIWLARYDDRFDTAGGVNLPKISVCYDAGGRGYRQLFKGEGGDDLRQDAVMEQVFDLVNVVLHRDRQTRRRNLSVRGYKVIPLAAQAGVLEFVGNTTPLQSWLLPAHLRFSRGDPEPKDVHAEMMMKRKQCKGKPEPLVELFVDIRRRFKPVMRHYFWEKHKSPIAWFAMRLEYTRSVATTSIVGHVLGLGDRHVSNILMDNVTGQVVHIDLGIAFEQGKLLPVPERVPFRLTADIIDGMGTAGTQGVFQRCSEETLRVLRAGSEVIMTVLEVFKYDPLHSWTASEVKVKRVQGADTRNTFDGTAGFKIGIDMNSGSAEEAADRALSAVARKLDKKLSVEYTVNELIAEATDVTNLATIFPGWAPYY